MLLQAATQSGQGTRRLSWGHAGAGPEQDRLEARRRAAEPNHFSSRKSQDKKAKPDKWSAKPGEAHRKPVLKKFSQAADDRTVLRIPKRWTLKKYFDVANSPRPSRPDGGVF
jgi:hypothetical protein